jgi:hypothetical protein
MTALAAQEERIPQPTWVELAEEIYRAIEHGDAEHRRWLREKLDEWARSRTGTEMPR